MGGPRHRPALAGSAFVAAGCVLASCGGSPAPHAATRTTSSSATTTTTSAALHAAGFTTVHLNAACSRGTLLSESVVASLSVPGKPPDVKVGAVPSTPGTVLPKGAPGSASPGRPATRAGARSRW